MRHDEAASQRNARAFVSRETRRGLTRATGGRGPGSAYDQPRGEGASADAGRSVFGTDGTEPGYGTSDGGRVGVGTVGSLPKIVLGHPVLGAFPADHSAVWEL